MLSKILKSRNDMETKILKLRNGEEIVGNVSIVDGEFLKVQNPLKVNIYPRMKGGRVEEVPERSLVGLVIVIISPTTLLKTMLLQ